MEQMTITVNLQEEKLAALLENVASLVGMIEENFATAKVEVSLPAKAIVGHTHRNPMDFTLYGDKARDVTRINHRD